MLSVEKYKYHSWKDVFETKKVDFEKLRIFSKWKDYFGNLNEHGEFKQIEKMLNEEINTHDVFPYPDLVFNIFNYLDLDDIKVVILGQDPYFKSEIYNGKKIPQAMGFSFSVPVGITIPSSLSNIFRNQEDFHIIQKHQPHGNLLYWVDQGCFLMNTALTVRENSAGSHCQFWKKITDKIIRHISAELNDITFVLWGGESYEKIRLIDSDKHQVIISSHPSGLSCMNTLKGYPAFAKFDQFGTINKNLINSGKSPINWQLF